MQLHRVPQLLPWLGSCLLTVTLLVGCQGMLNRFQTGTVDDAPTVGSAASERAIAQLCEAVFYVHGKALCVEYSEPVSAASANEQRTPPIDFTTQPWVPQIQCEGDGVSGNRVQVMYVHPPETNRYAEYLSSFQQWMAEMDEIFNASAAETDGTRHVRFVHDRNCMVVVLNVEVSSAVMDDSTPFAMWGALESLGYAATNRKYLVFAETNGYDLGAATFRPDDRLEPDNLNNQGPFYTATPITLWGPSNPAHELMHTLGAVNHSAPHGNGGHCTDEYDRMCTGDGGQIVCADRAHEQRFDCNHDDYFHTNPPPGSYLATHWNAANNSFLIGAEPIVNAIKIWTGASSTAWPDGNNWNPSGAPGAREDCVIPAGAPRYPVVVTEVRCEGVLTVHAGAELIDGPQGGLFARTATIIGTVKVLDGSYFDLQSALTVTVGGLLFLQNGDVGMQFSEASTVRVDGTVEVTGVFPIYGEEGSLDPVHLLISPSGLVNIHEGGLLSVLGSITNHGAFRQTQQVTGDIGIPFLEIHGTKYLGVAITPLPAADLGLTTVTIYGNQSCPASRSLGLTVGRCYTIEPTVPRRAEVILFYHKTESNGNPTPVIYQFNGINWDALPTDHDRSGDWYAVRAETEVNQSRFALKDPNVPTYYTWLPVITR